MSSPARNAHDTREAPSGFVRRYIFSSDHKVVGVQYFFLALAAVTIGIVLSLLMRFHLVWPAAHLPFVAGGIMAPEQYLALVTMHGTLMIFFVLTVAPQSAFALVRRGQVIQGGEGAGVVGPASPRASRPVQQGDGLGRPPGDPVRRCQFIQGGEGVAVVGPQFPLAGAAGLLQQFRGLRRVPQIAECVAVDRLQSGHRQRNPPPTRRRVDRPPSPPAPAIADTRSARRVPRAAG